MGPKRNQQIIPFLWIRGVGGSLKVDKQCTSVCRAVTEDKLPGGLETFSHCETSYSA